MCTLGAEESAFVVRKFKSHRLSASVTSVITPQYRTCSLESVGHLFHFCARIIISNNRK